ncbi:PilT/PilU family type 4a pilus ATPase [Dichelobacter nodosus]|uniref:Twitching motility protein PilU n=1 Tax=Dichelobacter nodosus (strain VCS1703A) TaxID=246195 RepID=A5EV69_DICNV|nr:PilT/PilU family type 4a pilus ATPase [Dichelobacter nodosus]ABQ13686.1 twitching motility protein PilU [Dichelobacter nodosus VCS1703A]AXM45540.1 PilT/PilU family type 4a pilus ATPase [Dichelobacter nodosus]KNZ39897.1 twitching motility protein PilU [Dichelobacter nodosus]TGA66735.1 PilT/PilU family type 4a pilus ATPase [Dichelobacter nodosus]
MNLDPKTLRQWFDNLVLFAHQREASDIFINSQNNVAVKTNGELHFLQEAFLDEEDVMNIAKAISRPEAFEEFLKTYECNIMVEVPNVTYLRVNIYMQKNMPGIVMRLIPAKIPAIEELNLPQPHILKELSLVKRGLVIIIGATGNGKSTTLASMVDFRNERTKNHIITVEDPIEFMHKSKSCVVIQREVGVDTKTYGAALKSSLREAPDVILIGEIRDVETMGYAMQFAETGHLCLATLHATNSVQALERIYNFFPLDQREKLQLDLSENLRCLITQRLIPKIGGGRAVAMEMMMNTPYIQQLIHDGQVDKIHEVLERGDATRGVFSFDRCIFDLYEEGIIEYDTALQFVQSANNFRVRVRNESKRRLPEDLGTAGDSYTVLSDDRLERELIRKAKEEMRSKEFGR